MYVASLKSWIYLPLTEHFVADSNKTRQFYNDLADIYQKYFKYANTSVDSRDNNNNVGNIIGDNVDI